MFSKTSRYRKLLDIVTTDAGGRRLQSKHLRLLPAVSGTFLHQIEEIDRLDHLAYKYYKQSRKWWHICDANPEFLSPQAMLGKAPVITQRFPLTPRETELRWDVLLKSLSEEPGVEDVKIEEKTRLLRQEQIHNGRPLSLHQERHDRAVVVTYNKINKSEEELINLIQESGFEVGPPQTLGRVGKEIVIPPDVV